MKRVDFNFFVFKDEPIEKDKIRRNFDFIQSEFDAAIGEKIQLNPVIVSEDLSELIWAKARPQSGGKLTPKLPLAKIFYDTWALWKEFGPKYDNVIYIFSPENWKVEYYIGWNLGMYNKYCVQILREQRENWQRDVLFHEIMHGINDLYAHDLGKSLDKYLGFSYDADPKQGVHKLNENPPPKYDHNFKPLLKLVWPFLISNLIYRRWDYQEHWRDKIRIDLNAWLGRYRLRSKPDK